MAVVAAGRDGEGEGRGEEKKVGVDKRMSESEAKYV